MEKRAGAWEYDEMLRVLCLYASVDIGDKTRISRETLELVKSHMPRRTIGTIKLRLSNYIARDPEMQEIGIKGLSGGGVHVDEIWQKFSDDHGILDHKKLLLEASRRL